MIYGVLSPTLRAANSPVCTGDLMESTEKTRVGPKIPWTSVLIFFIIATCALLGLSYFVIHDKDVAVAGAKAAYDENTQNPITKTQLQIALLEYDFATTQFPGNIVGPLTGYPKDKWLNIEMGLIRVNKSDAQ